MAIRRRQTERGERRERPDEAALLLGEEGRRGVLGGREVRIHRIEDQVRTAEHLGQRRLEVVVSEAEPVHSGVDLQMAVQTTTARGRRGLQSACGRGRRDRRCEIVREDAVEVADAQSPEDQNWGPNAGGAEFDSLLDVGAREHQTLRRRRIRLDVSGHSLERARHRRRAVAIRVGLDDGDQPRHRPLWDRSAEIRLQRPVVGPQALEVDACNGGSDHSNLTRGEALTRPSGSGSRIACIA